MPATLDMDVIDPLQATIIPLGTQTRDQIILGDDHVLRGSHSNRKCIIRPSAAANAAGCLVITEGYAGSALRNGARVEFLTLDGNQPVADTPYASAPELALSAVADAIKLHGSEQTVRFSNIREWRGIGARIEWNNAHQSDRISVPSVSFNHFNHCWIAIYNKAVDTNVIGNYVSDCRDYGLLDQKGAMQSLGNHFYGMDVAIAFGIPSDETYPDTDPWPPDAGASRSTGDTFADCRIGMLTYANRCFVDAAKTEHCWVKNIDAIQEIHISNSMIKVARTTTAHPGVTGVGIIGVDLGGLFSSVRGGAIYLNDYEWPNEPGDTGGCGIRFNNAVACWGHHIDTTIIANSADATHTDQVGILVPVGVTLQSSRITVVLEGFKQANCWGIDIKGVIQNCDIQIIALEEGGNIYNTNTDKRLRIPAASFGSSNRIRINNNQLTTGVAYPPP